MAKRILVVDDENEILMMMEARLQANGYETLSATDGAQALEIAKREKPDLIILDLMIPKMDGYKVCGLLKCDSRYTHIPIMVFTARARENDRKLAEEAGAEAYLSKPFDPKILLEKIREMIG